MSDKPLLTNDMKKLALTALATAAVVGGSAFYGGMAYGRSANRPQNAQFQGGQGAMRFQQQAGTGRTGPSGQRGGMMNGFIAGEIMAKDDASVTVKLRDGGTKIVFFSDKTEVGKTVVGTSADLEVGKTVTVSGTPNTDGSVTAQSIQLRPEGTNMMFGGPNGGRVPGGEQPPQDGEPKQ